MPGADFALAADPCNKVTLREILSKLRPEPVVRLLLPSGIMSRRERRDDGAARAQVAVCKGIPRFRLRRRLIVLRLIEIYPMSDNPIVELIPKKAAKEAVKETAKLTRELGGFLSKVFGTLPQDTIGVLGGDWLHHIRIRNAYRLQRRTEEILSGRGTEKRTEPLSSQRSDSFVECGARRKPP